MAEEQAVAQPEGEAEEHEFTKEELDGVKDVVENAGEAAVHAVRGQWDAAGDSLLSMSESALGVATGGISKAVEDGLDKPAQDLGFAGTHDMINKGLHAAGDAIGDGLTDLVGAAAGAAGAVGTGLSDLGSELGDLLGGGGHNAPAAPDQGAAAVPDQGAASVPGQGPTAADLSNQQPENPYPEAPQAIDQM
jgi:hypothetical protein